MRGVYAMKLCMRHTFDHKKTIILKHRHLITLQSTIINNGFVFAQESFARYVWIQSSISICKYIAQSAEHYSLRKIQVHVTIA